MAVVRRCLLVVVATLTLVACNDDGRELDPAPEVPDSRATLDETTTST